jgi:hypothetical protein
MWLTRGQRWVRQMLTGMGVYFEAHHTGRGGCRRQVGNWIERRGRAGRRFLDLDCDKVRARPSQAFPFLLRQSPQRIARHPPNAAVRKIFANVLNPFCSCIRAVMTAAAWPTGAHLFDVWVYWGQSPLITELSHLLCHSERRAYSEWIS